jgi:F-type H+-transporting ATPase subunit b
LKARSEAWLDQIEQYLASLPATEKAALAGQLENGDALTVVTASSLGAEEAETWRARLRHCLGDGVFLVFNANPTLLAGAELHFPAAVLRFSWHLRRLAWNSRSRDDSRPRSP